MKSRTPRSVIFPPFQSSVFSRSASDIARIAALACAYEAFSVQNTQLKEQIASQANASAEERERFQRQLDVCGMAGGNSTGAAVH